MLRDNLAGSSSRCSAARGGLLSRCTLTGGSHRTIDPLCLENPRPAGAEPTLTENVASPFQAEPGQIAVSALRRLPRCPSNTCKWGRMLRSGFRRGRGTTPSRMPQAKASPADRLGASRHCIFCMRLIRCLPRAGLLGIDSCRPDAQPRAGCYSGRRSNMDIGCQTNRVRALRIPRHQP
jgi:hypothetical protein